MEVAAGHIFAAVETWPSSADPLLLQEKKTPVAWQVDRRPNVSSSRPAEPALFIRAALAFTQRGTAELAEGAQ